jgi:hypothetical protein
MSEKRMACWNCPRYNREDRVCLDGKANPKKKVDAVAVAEFLGLRALCHYSPHRDQLALLMHFPATPLARAAVTPKRKRRGQGKVEVEIIESEEA